MSNLVDPQDVDPTTRVRSLSTGQVPVSVRRRRGRHGVRWVALVVALGLGGVAALAATAPPTSQYQAASPLLDHRAPPVPGTTLTGERFDLGTLRGHYVVVDFFASWCVPCRTEQDQLIRFAQYPRDGAVLVGVVFHDSTASIRSLLGPWVGLYPVLTDPGGTIALDYGVDNPPSKYVVDPKGRVVAKIVGPVTAAGLDAVIARAQAGRL